MTLHDRLGMGDLDDFDLFGEPTPANPAAPAPRKCRRHEWGARVLTTGGTLIPSPSRSMGYVAVLPDTRIECLRCGKPKDDTASRRGRTNRSRGNAIERRVASRNGGARTGQFGGKNDVTNDLFHFQVKSRKGKAFPRWMSDELDALRPSSGQREAVLVVVEAFSDRKPARTLYVVDEPTWLSLHGKGDDAA
jgi:hypothetical protein